MAKPPRGSKDVETSSSITAVEATTGSRPRPPTNPPDLMLTSLSVQQSTRGPMPSADEFQKYAQASPAAADAIVKYMLDEQAHRHKLASAESEAYVDSSKKLTDEQVRSSKHGQWIFGALAGAAVIGCVVCAVAGATAPAIVLGAVAPILMGREVVIGWIRGKPGKAPPPDEPPPPDLR